MEYMACADELMEYSGEVNQARMKILSPLLIFARRSVPCRAVPGIEAGATAG